MLTHVNYRTGAHARHGAPSRAPRTTPARWRCGTWRTAPARCRWTCAAPAPTSPSAAATSTSTAARARRPSCGCTRATPTASGSRCRAGGATPRRSSSRPTTGPAPGIARYLCGTPPVLCMAALECGVDTVLAAEPLGGMAALRAQVAGADRPVHRAGGGALRRPRPRPRHAARRTRSAAARSASTRDEGAYAIVQALIARGVIGDFRAAARHPALRLHAAVPALRRRVGRRGAPARRCCDSGEWRRPEFNRQQAVT